jgi:hypothetical protein
MLALLERDESGAEQAVRLADADGEEIRFTKLLDEQRPAAVFRLDELRETRSRTGSPRSTRCWTPPAPSR